MWSASQGRNQSEPDLRPRLGARSHPGSYRSTGPYATAVHLSERHTPGTFAGATLPSRRRFLPIDYALFSALTVANVGVVVFGGARWLAKASTVQFGAGYWLLTALIGGGLLMWEYRWLTLPLMRVPPHVLPQAGLRVAVVTTFVPEAEPQPMLATTLEALVGLSYPHETWVLDEGDDASVRELCARLGARHFSRKGTSAYQARTGPFAARTKHGNYNAWLDAYGFEHYDVLVAFDPDHIPAPDFLTQTVGYLSDPAVGYVQVAQAYYNQEASFIARGAAEETYAYYSSMMMVSYAGGSPIVTGCHTVHRLVALREVGGFAPHDADDLLITLLYQASGWKGVYVPGIFARGLTPVDWGGYFRQQRRWGRSVLDIKLRVFPELAHRLSPRARLVWFLHGLYYLHGLATALGIGVLCAALALGRNPTPFAVGGGHFWRGVAIWVAVFLACDLFRQRFYLAPRIEFGLHVRAGFLRFAKWASSVLALLDAVTGRRTGYTITYKTSKASFRLATAPHLLTMTAITGAWVAGKLEGNPQPPLLEIAAAVILVASAAIVFSELRGFEPPFVPERATAASRQLQAEASARAAPIVPRGAPALSSEAEA